MFEISVNDFAFIKSKKEERIREEIPLFITENYDFISG